MINMLLRYCHFRRNSKRSTSIQIPIILGKGTRTSLQADTMPGFEYLTGVPAINREDDRPSTVQSRMVYSYPRGNGHRTMPSQRRWTKPDGQMSTSFAMKSVSGTEEEAYNSTRIGPVTSTSLLERFGHINQHIIATFDG